MLSCLHPLLKLIPAWYSIDFRLHRSLVILPMLFSSFISFRGIMNRNRWFQGVGILVAVGIFTSGMFYSIHKVLNQEKNLHYSVIQAMGTPSVSGTVSLADTHFDTIASLYDEMRYFLPGFTTRNDTEDLKVTDCQKPDAVMIVIHKDHSCFAVFRSSLKKKSRVVIMREHTYLVAEL